MGIVFVIGDDVNIEQASQLIARAEVVDLVETLAPTFKPHFQILTLFD